jgi:hypothetical protein
MDETQDSAGNASNRLHGPTVATGLVAVVPWLAVAAIMMRWVGHMAAGTMEPGAGTTWNTLILLLVVLPLAGLIFAAVVFATAWMGKRNVRWQVFSMVLGVLMVWMTVGD